LYFEGIKIPSSTDKKIKKIKKELNGHAMHGNKVWNSTFVLMDVLKSIEIKDNKILDLGCGWGVLTSYLDKKGAISHGIDADPSVEPFFNWVAKESKTNPKFILGNIFSDDLPLDYDQYVVSDVCFWDDHVDLWKNLIERLNANGKKILMSDPGRESFWKLLDEINIEYNIERVHIMNPKKIDSYIVIFGE
jgi:predicted nicotinamide N-methyase|tara:strand:+ start:461 stop:1033 length:573 start_codon:yes stop_codon:yes gene_type:complete